MSDETSSFFLGAALTVCAVLILTALLDPWNSGYCAATCGSAGVVEGSAKVCTCGPEDAPVAVKIREGK